MRKPNFNFERQERDKAKAAKKAAKADAKATKTDREVDEAASEPTKVHGDSGTAGVAADVTDVEQR